MANQFNVCVSLCVFNLRKNQLHLYVWGEGKMMEKIKCIKIYEKHSI